MGDLVSFSVVSTLPGQAGVGVLRLVGELDLCGVDRLLAAVRGCVAADGYSAVVLDLSRLNFLDCAGARALVTVRAESAAQGVELVLAAPTAAAARHLRLTTVAAGLPCHPSVRSAVDACQDRRVRRSGSAARSA
jgi:anti-anti-sigma factor